jgi:hypothetical protein
MTRRRAAADWRDNPRTTGRPRRTNAAGCAADRGEGRVSIQCGDGAGEYGGVGELGIVVEAEDDAAMPERRATVAPACNAMVAVERQERRVPPSGDESREPGQSLRPRTLVDDEHMARHTGLRQGRADRCRRLRGAVEREDHHIGVVGIVGRAGGAGNVTRGHPPLPTAGIDR